MSTEHHSGKPIPLNKIENHPGFNENARNPTWTSEDTLIYYDTAMVAPHRRSRAGVTETSTDIASLRLYNRHAGWQSTGEGAGVVASRPQYH